MSETKAKARQPSLEELLKQFAAIFELAQRREFYRANPRLAEVYSAVNFSEPASEPSERKVV